jgi:hypothetical protein
MRRTQGPVARTSYGVGRRPSARSGAQAAFIENEHCSAAMFACVAWVLVASIALLALLTFALCVLVNAFAKKRLAATPTAHVLLPRFEVFFRLHNRMNPRQAAGRNPPAPVGPPPTVAQNT